MSEPPPREGSTDTDAGADRTPVPVRERADGYFRNGIWVPRGTEPDPQPPGWRERLESQFGIRVEDRRLWVGAAVVLLVLVVVVVVLANRGGPPQRSPKAQRDFLRAVQRGQMAVQAGNDITVVTAARERASEVCRDLPRDGSVENWTGTLTKVGTVFGGKQGEVAVSLGDGVHLRTWNHKSQDTKDHTLVDSHSDVYQQLSHLQTGDLVLVSGNFVPKGAICIHETSLFDRNGMLTPGFVFRFTSVVARHP
jgi:hypothetical protein